MSEFDFLKMLMSEYGPIVVMGCFFIWRDWKREQRMSESIEKMQTWIQEKFLTALERCTAAQERCTAVLEELKNRPYSQVEEEPHKRRA